MGEKQNQPFQLSFNAALKVDFQGSRVTSDGGLILVRELDERLGFSELIEQHLTDPRGTNTRLPLADLLRQSVYSRLAGYEDMNDAERLSQDPTFRLIGSEKIWERGAALTSRLQTFETEMLAEEGNFAGLARLNRELIGKAEALDSPSRTVLDMDSTEIPVYGEQEQSAYNGHFESTCYHPLLLFSREGDCLAAKLRPGNVHSAEGWEELLLPEIERQQKLGKEVVFRADAAFAKPEIYEALEERGVKYAIRIPANENLELDIAELLPRPVGRPSLKPLVEYKGFLYQAASWKTARRVVAKVEHHHGELFPRVPQQVGWDWFSIQLQNNSELMLYRLRRKDGSADPFSAGTFVDPQGRSRHFTAGEFELVPSGVWTSPATGARYPLRWQIRVPALNLALNASSLLSAQEIVSRFELSPNYWEGAVDYQGTIASQPISGVGYLEMTGYDKPVTQL